MKLKLILLSFISLTVLINSERIRYDNYKVYRFVPKTEEQRDILLELQSNNPGVQFWKGVRHLGQPVDIMFPPHLQNDMVNELSNKRDMNVSVFIENVQELIDQESEANREGRSNRLNWYSYGSLSEIEAFLNSEAAKHPNIAKVESIGKTFEDRDIQIIKISKSAETKPAIWIDSTIHAREWISAAVSTYVINELLNSNDPEIVKLTEDFDWYILPVANPDGYVHSQTYDRLWRKTRTETGSPFGCRGADANRNWDYEWLTGGSSTNPCTDTYAGSEGFSEPETKAQSDFYNTIADRAVFYLSIHSYSQLIILPYGHSEDHKYDDFPEYMRIGQAAADALSQRFGTQFVVGNIVDLLYVSSGGSVDWIKGVHDTSLVMAYELRDTGRYGFLLPPHQIIPSGLEFLDSLLEIMRQLRVRIETKRKPESKLPVAESNKPAILPVGEAFLLKPYK